MRLITALLLLLAIRTAAQPFNWQWSRYATATASVPDVQGFATDASGNSYITGTFYGTATFGALPPLTSAGQSDVFVVKYNAQGEAMWATRAGGTDFDDPYDLAIDGLGGVYITGSFQSATAAFGSTTLTRTGLMDIFVAKVDAADGQVAWAQRFGSNDFQSGQVEWGRAIACDGDGNVYVSGCFKYTLDVAGLPTLQGCSQYYNSFLLKLDGDGHGLWSRRPDCGHQWIYSASEGQALTVGADGMVYAGFRMRGDTLFVEADTLLNQTTTGSTHDGVVIKYAPDGTPQWARGIGGYGYDDVQALQADATGHLYVAMHREGSYGNLGIPGIDVAGNLGIYRNVVLKYDADGHLRWGTRLGNSTYDHDIEAMVLEDPEHLLVAGWHQGNFEIGGITPDPGVSGSYGLYLARFDSSSALTDVLALRYTYPRGIRGLGLDEGGNIYAAGYFQDSLALPGLAPMQLPGAGDHALFLARSGDFPTALQERTGPIATAFPVPSTGLFTVGFDQPFDAVELRDPTGRLLRTDAFAPTTQRLLTMGADGIILCRLLRDGRSVGQCRVVVMR